VGNYWTYVQLDRNFRSRDSAVDVGHPMKQWVDVCL
jgi:hypothetical protein